MLRINKLRFSYPSSNFTLDIDDLEFTPGEITAIIGGNGCGKTTLFRLMSGVYLPDSPCFSFNGVNTRKSSDMGCSIVMHNAYGGISPRLTVLQNAQFIARLYGADASVQRIKELASSINCAEYLSEKSNSLSAGQSQKALLLRTLASNPDIVLLDEPTTALDVVGIETTLKWIKSLADIGKTVVVSTHHLYELGMMQPNVVGMKNGKIVCDLKNKNNITSPVQARDLIHSIIGEVNEY